MYFHKAQEKPQRWGNFQDIQYAVRVNSAKVYDCDPDNNVLVMPLFWGLPPMDYSGKKNHGTNYGSTYKDGSLDFNGTSDYISTTWPGILGANPRSVFARVRLDGVLAVDNATIVGWGGNNMVAGKRYHFRIDDSNNYGLRVEIKSGYVSGTTAVGAGWRSVGHTFDGSNVTDVKLFLDGKTDTIVASVAQTIDTENAIPFTVARGTLAVSQLRYFAGMMEFVSVFDVALTANQIALFHDRPWDLYRPVSRPIYSIPTAPSLYIPQIIIF